MTLDLYTIDGSCSDAVRFLLDHLDLPHRALPRREHRAALEAVNPDATVPTLVAGDLVLTESVAILTHLAEVHAPDLLGRDARERALVTERLSLLSTGVYAAYMLHFRPDRFAGSDDAKAEIRAGAPAAIDAALASLARMSGPEHVALGRLTVCDFLALVFLRWQQNVEPATIDRAGLGPLWRSLTAQAFYRPSFATAA